MSSTEVRVPALFTSFVLTIMLQRICASGLLAPCRHMGATLSGYSTQQSSDKIGPGPGSRSRSVDQARAADETSTTHGPESSPARSPDAPADPADLAANRGADPQEVLRSSSWQAQQAMSSSYDDRDERELNGSILAGGTPQAAGRFAEKVSSAADIAAQAATGAASVMSDAVKAATGAAVGISGHRRAADAHMDASPDASPVSDGALDASNDRVLETNPDTAASSQHVLQDTASGTADADMLAQKAKEGGYQEAADRLMDIEGLPKSAGKSGTS